MTPSESNNKSSHASSEAELETDLRSEGSTDSTISIQATDFAPSADRGTTHRFKAWQILVAVFCAGAIFVFWFLFTSKSVQIQFVPNANSVSISGGFVFELGGVYLLREGSYQLDARAELHEPLTTVLSVGALRNQALTFEFIPEPGFLDLKTNPADALVQVDGIKAEHGQALSLAAGAHELQVIHPRYQTHIQEVVVTGKQIHQALSVVLAPNWADVQVGSIPTGAEVWLDGQPSGVLTPGVVQALAGEREVSVHLDGHKTHRERIFAQAGVSLSLSEIELVQADAQLRISSVPSKAGVTLNGVFVGQTPTELDLKSNQNHTVAVFKNGYAGFSRTLSISRGEQRSLNAQLVQQKGEVVVRSQPEGALLAIDGKDLGLADQSLRLPIKPHEIVISLPGYAGYRQTITPKVGLTQEVKVKLLTLAEARLAALKPSIKTAQGKILKLFEPFDFTMGASRREPGRRANETLRSVEMDRLFYLATHEVTNAEFRGFASGHDSGSFVEININEDDMPVSSVSWNEAAAYCNWLSDKDDLPHFYRLEFGKVVGVNADSIGYRLPTEAEWSWAARSQLTVDANENNQLRFPWGDNLPPPDRHGNFADRAASSLVGRVIFGFNDNHPAASPVGTFKANQRGLFDLGGNVAEWLHDYYEIPSNRSVSNPTGPASGEYHVIKDSSWMHGTITELRYSFRDYGADGRQDLGFRIARYAE